MRKEQVSIPGGAKKITAGWLERAPGLLLVLAIAGALAVYSVALKAPWFYDDADYVLSDPRLEQLALFSPFNWHKPPPALPQSADPAIHLPGYDKPLIADRYVWRLSFALERRLAGPDYSPKDAHRVNLLFHLLCVVMLFFSLRRLLTLYADEFGDDDKNAALWQLWPGLAALIFAVHPWAAEPVCYVSARNGSMGALFSLGALFFWCHALHRASPILWRAASLAAMTLCCLAAYGSKENFLIAPAVILVLTWPVVWKRLTLWSRPGALMVLAGSVAALALVGWLGIRGSDRAAGLFAQTAHGQGWNYALEIQSPLLFMTLLDQVPCVRLSLETGHPGWPIAACWLALFFNAAILIVCVSAGRRWPLLLGLAAFYLLLLPTNSILPRPDFLAARNVYLPCAAVCAVIAGVVLYLATRVPVFQRNRAAIFAITGALLLFWSLRAHAWAAGFVTPSSVWLRSAAVAPEHSTVRLNAGYALLNQASRAGAMDSQTRAATERELNEALRAEDSATMRYHTERPRTNRKMLAYRGLASLRRADGDLVGAEEYIRQSWRVSHALQTWLVWVDLCFDDSLRDKMPEVLAEGFRVWPAAWWPPVLRGIYRGRKMQPKSLSPESYADLLRAELAPDSPIPELRTLQVRVLSIIAQSRRGAPRSDAILQRLTHLGVPEKDIEEIQERIRAQ